MANDKGIPVVDLFAGPGGLGEGFASISDDNKRKVFNIRLSIEKDENAYKTLRLRSFYRQFKIRDIPHLYYSYVKENSIDKQNFILEKLKKQYPREWNNAENESWCYELPYPEEFDKNNRKKGGYSNEEILERHRRIDDRISRVLPENNNWLLTGGPPCQAYSLVGRSRNQGISDDDHRVHLYKEYLRVIAKHHPAVFVMENVKGLLSANVNGEFVFNRIKEDLKNPSHIFKDLKSPRYKVFSLVKEPDRYDIDNFPVYDDNKDFLIRSEDYQIPQRRHRVILLGLREDVSIDKYATLKKVKEKIALQDVIGSLPKLRSGIGREIVGANENKKHKYNKIDNSYENWKEILFEAYSLVKPHIDKPVLIDVNNAPITQGNNYIKYRLVEKNNPLKKWFNDSMLKGVLNHETRTHLKEDLARYLFSSLYLEAHEDFPKLRDYPEELLPKHKNAKGNKFADRFRTQKPIEPATTITSHISKDGHYFIHYDPEQCRSLTVREAARVQTFPDNYYFCGSRTHQYHQVGNAVPPYLARQIAVIVNEIFRSNNESEI